MEVILGSNLVRTFGTFFFGAVLYAILGFWPRLFPAIGFLVAIGLLFGFLFEIGEVYQYTQYYKRTFFIFGDEITTVLILFFTVGVLARWDWFSSLMAVAIFISGGRFSIVLLVLAIVLLVRMNKALEAARIGRFIKYLSIGLILYVALVPLANLLKSTGAVDFVQLQYLKAANFLPEKFDTESKNSSKDDAFKVRGLSACKDISTPTCIFKQVKAAAAQRYYSSLAGLWMTVQGGYRGDAYPATPDEFASLMIRENPWRLNDTAGLEYRDWKKMHGPQNPYLRFGSGYGYWLLGGLIVFFGIVCLSAYMNTQDNEKGPVSALSVFFLVNVILNQAQSWLMIGSPILVLLGFCASHIVIKRLLTYFPSSRFLRPVYFEPIVHSGGRRRGEPLLVHHSALNNP